MIFLKYLYNFCFRQALLGFGIENYSKTVGSFSNDDGDGNENAKKKQLRKTTNLHVHNAFLVHFSAVSARIRLENAYRAIYTRKNKTRLT